MTDSECVELLQWALPRLSLRWRGFSNVRGQVCKRIARRMKALGIADAHAYRLRLETDRSELAYFDELCRVTITRFYRDRAVYDALRETLLPELAERAISERRPLRIWSAGCASGEEPYTLAILMHQEIAPRHPGLGFELIATDADVRLIERAAEATYPEGTLRELPRAWIDEAFTREDGSLRLKPPYRERVTFLIQDLRREAPEGLFDVILCRNVAFTYFDEALQTRTLERLIDKLQAGGLLVIGGHEQLPRTEPALEVAARALPIFRRRGPAGPTEPCRSPSG